MRTAAGAAIQILNGDDANDAFPLGWLAKAQILRGIFETDGYRPVLEDNFIGAALGFPNLRRLEDTGDIDGARFDAQMETHGLCVEQVDQHGRQKMLARVLLHVIEAALPVDDARDLAGLERRGYLMRDPTVFIHYLRDVNRAQLSDVVRLATGSGIKSGAIEINPQAIRARLYHAGSELSQITVVIIKALRH